MAPAYIAVSVEMALSLNVVIISSPRCNSIAAKLLCYYIDTIHTQRGGISLIVFVATKYTAAGAVFPPTAMYYISLEPEFYVLQGGGAEFLKNPPKIAQNIQKPPKDLKISIKAFPMPAIRFDATGTTTRG